MSKRLSDSEIQSKLDNHKLWLAGKGGAKADFSNVNLIGHDFIDLDLRFADFTCAKLYNCSFSKSNLVGAIFNGADLFEANMRECNLTEALLIDAKLINVTFLDANLNRADLTSADLTSSHLERANLSYATLRHAILKLAYLHGADLSKADLTYANLSNAILNYANLNDACLNNTYLKRTTLQYSSLLNTDFSSSTIIHSDFKGVVVKDTNLLNVTITMARGISVISIQSGTTLRNNVVNYWVDFDIITDSKFQGSLSEYKKKVEDSIKYDPSFLVEKNKKNIEFIEYLATTYKM